jgi:hypothetical protein
MKLASISSLVVLGLLLPLTSRAETEFSVTFAPPVLRTYEQTPCPTEGYIWTPGYWSYDDSGYYWVPGVWVAPPQVGYLWTPGYWALSNGIYAFNTGYWGPTVGFYGGVNYGYGYQGDGYYGGRWEGGAFRYNTAYSRVDASIIHNTYADRTARSVTQSRASFNGPGGVNARPSAEQVAAASGAHSQPTAAQLEHRQTASRDQSLRSPTKPAGPNATGERSVNPAEANKKTSTPNGPANVRPERIQPAAATGAAKVKPDRQSSSAEKQSQAVRPAGYQRKAPTDMSRSKVSDGNGAPKKVPAKVPGQVRNPSSTQAKNPDGPRPKNIKPAPQAKPQEAKKAPPQPEHKPEG